MFNKIRNSILLALCLVSANAAAIPMRLVEWGENWITVESLADAMQVTTQTTHGTALTSSIADCKIDEGVYRLPVTPGQLVADEGFYLKVAFNDNVGTKVDSLCVRVPILISAYESLSDYDVSLAEGNGLVVLDGGVAVVDPNAETYTFNYIRVQGGGRLVVPDQAELITDTLILRAGTIRNGKYVARYPQLVVVGSLKNTLTKVWYDYLVSTKQYYTLSVPQDTYIANISYEDGSPMRLGQSLYVSQYNGAVRATGASGWTVFSGTKLLRGQGYTVAAVPQYVRIGSNAHVQRQFALMRIPFTMSLALGDSTGNVNVPVSAYPAQTGRDNDAGWNLVGNPYVANYLGEVDGLVEGNGIGILVSDGSGYVWEGDLRYVVIPSDDGQSYAPMLAKNATLPPFKNFFVQIGTGDALQFLVTNRQDFAPIRRITNDTPPETITGVVLATDDGLTKDYMGVLIREDYTLNYEFNADLAKWPNQGLNIYALPSAAQSDNQLAFIAINDSLAQSVSIGCTFPENGYYTLTVDPQYTDSLAGITLYDAVEKCPVDLLQGPYRFYATAATVNQRFTLSVARTQPMPTSLNNVAGKQECARKYIQGGQLFIQVNNRVFTSDGQLIRE